MIGKLIANIIVGGVTGFGTNSIAVKMLFKNYGPFGGVIVKTRDEFIENISSLVERDIINHKSLEKELSKDEFKVVFETIVSDICQRYIYENTDDRELIDLPGVKETIGNFLMFSHENKEDFILNFLEVLFDNVEVHELLSQEQIQALSDNILDMSIQALEDGNILEDMIKNIYLENNRIEVSEFIPRNVFNKVNKNLKYATKDLHTQLENKFDKNIDEAISNLYSHLRVSNILRELEDSINDKTISQLLGKEKTDNVANEVLARVGALLKSKEVEGLINRFIDDLLQMLRSVDLSIIDVLNDDIGYNLELYMSEKLPELVERFILWIKNNRGEIDQLIDEAVQDTLHTGSGFKAKIKSLLYDLFLDGKIAKKFKIVSMLVEGIQSQTDIHKLSQEISKELIITIKNSSISELVKTLENNNIINSKEITSLIQRDIDKYIDKVDMSSFDSLFNNRIGDSLDLDMAQYFEENIKGIIIKEFKSKFLYNEKLTKSVHQEISKTILEVSNFTIGKLIPEDKLDSNLRKIKDSAMKSLKNNREDITKALSKVIREEIDGKKFSHLLDSDIKQKITQGLGEKSHDYLKETIDTIANKKVKLLYNQINKSGEVPKKLTGMTSGFINNNLEKLMEGRIQGLVKENLSDLPDETLQSMVEGFMGTELKNINRFGALLGGASGIGFAFAQGKLGIHGPASMVSSTFLYGLVGYLTNVIALKMIFRPYTEKRILSVKVPYTPGVVTKEKPRFAQSMGSFIEDDLLNAKKVDDIFRNKKSDIKVSFINTISNNNYKMVETLLLEHIDPLSNKVLSGSVNFINSNKSDLADALLDEIKYISLDKIDFNPLEKMIKKKSGNVLLDSQAVLLDKVGTTFKSDECIGNILPNGIKDMIHDELGSFLGGKINQLIEFINDDRKIDILIKEQSPMFEELIDKSLDDILSKEEIVKLKERSKKYLFELISSKETKERLMAFAEDKFLKEVDPEKRIGDIFEGKLIKTLYDNSDFITKSIIEKLIKLLQSEKSSFKEIAVTTAADNTGYKIANFFLDIDKTIRGVVDNLIDKKVPKFINNHEDDYSQIINGFLKKVEKSKVGDIGLDLSGDGVEKIIGDILTNETLYKNIGILSDGVIDSISSIKLKYLLRAIPVRDLTDVAKIFNREIDILRNSISCALVDEQTSIKNEVENLLKSVLEDLFYNIKVSTLSHGIDNKDMEKIITKCFSNINNGKAYHNSFGDFITQILSELKYKDADEVIEFRILHADVISTLANLINNDKVISDLKHPLNLALRDIFININKIIEKPTKDYALNLAIDSSIPAIENHFLDLMNSLNIKQITEAQINAMNPKEIETLFNSFAKRYFRKLEAYGLVGGGVGLLSEGGMLLLLKFL